MPTTAQDELLAADAAQARADVDAAVAHLSAAIRALTADGRPCEGAMACLRLGDLFAHGLGNLTAARAWYGRAARLVEDQPACVEQGWVAVAAMGCDVEDPDLLLRQAELALDRARRFGDVALETKALADAGLAQVQRGQLADGMRLLDEAMALACANDGTDDTNGKSVCSFFTACYHAGDFGRAASWTPTLRTRGLLGSAAGTQAFLSSHCDSLQGALLIELGRWTEAEALLLRADDEFERVMGTPSWHPAIGLADLRVLQGRLTDAEALLLGKDASPAALLPAARLQLARGDHDLALAMARRGLGAMRADRLRAAELLAVVVEAELGRGDVVAAREASDDLARRTGDLDVAALVAVAAVARARVAAASGELDVAAAVAQEAADALADGRAPWRRVGLLVLLARVRALQGDHAGARVDARAARSELASLDVVLPPDDAAVLDRLDGAAAGASATRQPRRPDAPDGPASLRREGRTWVAEHCGTVARLADTKGLRYLAVLLARPGVERHALDLVDAVAGVDLSVDRRTIGDAGPLADGAARRAYRVRIEELRGGVEDALAVGAADRAEALQGEIDALVGQLAQAFGIGGRSRVASSAAERARLNVTRAIRTAIDRIEDVLPAPGVALDRGVRTGMYSTYEPPSGDITWIVHPSVNGGTSR